VLSITAARFVFNIVLAIATQSCRHCHERASVSGRERLCPVCETPVTSIIICKPAEQPEGHETATAAAEEHVRMSLSQAARSPASSSAQQPRQMQGLGGVAVQIAPPADNTNVIELG